MPAWDEAEVELCREAHLAPEALLAGRARRLVREEQVQPALQKTAVMASQEQLVQRARLGQLVSQVKTASRA